MLFKDVLPHFASGGEIRRASWSPRRYWRLIRDKWQFARLADAHPHVRGMLDELFDFPLVFEVDEDEWITSTLPGVFLPDLLADDWRTK